MSICLSSLTICGRSVISLTDSVKQLLFQFKKKQKNHSNPLNYRPIAQMSCLCKLFERMINNKLVEYLENNKVITNVQCGFRKYRGTVDHLIRLETNIRKGMADKKITLGVFFFDVENAYDTTWRYHILRDLYTY